MRSLQLILVVFVLLSYVPPVRSGLNIYIKRMFDSCWLLKGTCRESCQPREIFNIFCGTQYLCCIDPEDMPTLFVK
ncbi:beta-defensin 135 [Cricetulus griseus]|uniref:Beta-defensin n=1 Tax=Cricetulus griseus TaxID=10029 RepID=A0A8C2MZL1_CRIGR|nr:beta-defensin 135 [Cricetulus griseus]XP_035308397.1 beta-defensin 135 [Cricetulus griseus]